MTNFLSSSHLRHTSSHIPLHLPWIYFYSNYQQLSIFYLNCCHIIRSLHISSVLTSFAVSETCFSLMNSSLDWQCVNNCCSQKPSFYERELSRIIREFTKIIISFNLRQICGNYTFPFWKNQIGHQIMHVWRSVTKVWRTQKVRHTIKQLTINKIDPICDEVPRFWKKFFFCRHPICHAFAVAPLYIRFFIYVRAKEERTHPQPIPGEGSCLWIFAYL